MTLLRCSLICALTALGFLILHHAHLIPATSMMIGFYLPLTGSVVFGSLGAFVFRNY